MDANGHELQGEVALLLYRSRARIRRIYLLRGLAVTLAVALSGVLAVMAIDVFFTIFSDFARALITFALYALVAVAALLSLVRPLARKLDNRRLASILDGRHPENKERLTTLVEIAERAARGEKSGFSPALTRILAGEAAEVARRIDPVREFTARTILARLKYLVAAGALLGMSFFALPNVAGRLFVRAIAPWTDIGNLYSGDIKVEPGDLVVLKGEKVKIRVELAPRLHASAWIRISRRQAGGRWGEESAERMPESGVYETIASPDEREWRYRITAGPAVTRHYAVRVCEMPRYRSFTAKVAYPEYTGLGTVTYSNQAIAAVRAVEGTRVSFALDLADPGVKGEFRIDGQEIREHAMSSNRTAVWTLELENELGYKAPRQSGALVSLVDQPPTVVIEKPAVKNLQLAPHAKLPLEVTASDDIAIARTSLRYRIDGGPWIEWRPLARLRREGQSLWLGADEADLSLLDLALARQVQFDVTVSDACPEAHVVTSMPVTVNLELGAKSFDLQDLGAQAAEARKLLDEARRRLGDAQNPANLAKDAIRRERRVSQDADRNVERAAHEANEARKRLKELAAKLGESARLRPVAERLERAAAARLVPALAALEKAQFVSPDERAAALEKALADLRSAARAVEKLKEPLEARVKAVEDYERTRDLAARQRALEEAAREILRERPVDTKKLEAWKRMEDEASRQALELSSRLGEAGLDEARRQMDKAAEKMGDLKRELDIRSNAALNGQQRARQLAELEKAAENRLAVAAKEAENSARIARAKLDEAMKNDPLGVRWFHVKEAEEAAKRVQDAMARAERGEAERARQQAEFAAKLAEVKEALSKVGNEQRARQLAQETAAAAKRNRDVRAFDAAQEAERREQAQEAMAEAREAAMELRKALARRERAAELCEAMSAAIGKADKAAEKLAKMRPPLGLQKAEEAVATAEREALRKACEAELARQAAGTKQAAGEPEKAKAEAEKARMAAEEAVRAAEAAHAIQKAANEALDRVDEARKAEIDQLHAETEAENAERAYAQVANGRDGEQIRARREKLETAKKTLAAAREAVEQTKVEAAAAVAKAEKLAERTGEKNAAEKADEAAEAVREAMAKAADEAVRKADEATAARAAAEAKTRSEQRAKAALEREAKAERSRQAAKNDPNNQQGKAQRATARNEAMRAIGETVQHQQKAEEALADGDERRAAREMKAAEDSARRAAEKLAESAPSEKLQAAQENVLAGQRKLNDAQLPKGVKGRLAKAQQELKEVQKAVAQAIRETENKPNEQKLEGVRARTEQAQGQMEAAVEKTRDGWSPEREREAARQERAERNARARAERAAQAAERAASEQSEEAGELAQAQAEGEARRAQEAQEAVVSRDGQQSDRQGGQQKGQQGGQQSDQQKGQQDGQQSDQQGGRQNGQAEGSQSGKGEGGSNQGQKSDERFARQAAEAAENAAKAAERAAARRGRELGMDEDKKASNGNASGKGGASEGRSQGSKSAEGGGSSGAYGEIAKLAQELRSNDDPERRKLQFEKTGWYQVKGAAKDGLGERDLKDIPADYRDLVRDYFLKLSQEK